MCGPGNEDRETDETDETVDERASYYYDDATGYEIYREDQDDEDEAEPDGAGEPRV